MATARTEIEEFNKWIHKSVTLKEMSGIEPTHLNLTKIAAKWLRKRNQKCAVIVTNAFAIDSFGTMARGEQPDAIGWWNNTSTLVECKISREDFFRNYKKKHQGMGRQRYFLIPEGLVELSEVPETWGLLSWDGRKVSIALDAPYREDYDQDQETAILLAALRRVRPDPDGITTIHQSEWREIATLEVEVEHNAQLVS